MWTQARIGEARATQHARSTKVIDLIQSLPRELYGINVWM